MEDTAWHEAHGEPDRWMQGTTWHRRHRVAGVVVWSMSKLEVSASCSWELIGPGEAGHVDWFMQVSKTVGQSSQVQESAEKQQTSCWLDISNLNAFNKKDRDGGLPIWLEALGHPRYIHASFPHIVPALSLRHASIIIPAF